MSRGAGAGIVRAMSVNPLWAPWRMHYIKQMGGGPPEGCFLCEGARHAPDSAEGRSRHILVNDERGLLLLNRFPYTNGHLMAAPAAHLGTLNALGPEIRASLMELAALGERLLQAAFDPQGVNVGINVGQAAGAGVPGHLHVHVVPRWGGDTNFMTVVGGVRVIPEALEETHRILGETLAALGD